MAKVKFEGKQYFYDETAIRRYSVVKKISRYNTDPAGFFDALDELFAGKADEYAEALGDDFEKMSELFAAIMQDQGEPVKN